MLFNVINSIYKYLEKLMQNVKSLCKSLQSPKATTPETITL